MVKVRTLPARQPVEQSSPAVTQSEPTFQTKMSLLEQRICTAIIRRVSSIDVYTFGNPYKWDTCITVRLDEDDPHDKRTIMDELCDDLRCDLDEAVWAMTCIDRTLYESHCVLPGKATLLQQEQIRQIAIKMMRCYAVASDDDMQKDLGEFESEEDQKLTNRTVKHVMILLEKNFQPIGYAGHMRYNLPDAE